MKKTLRIMGLCALVVLAAVSCKKNEGKTTVEAVITQPTSNAKTGIDGLNLVWHSGDEIEVFNANDIDDYAIFTTTGSGITATFTSESDMEVSDGYFAFYPHEDITTPMGTFDLALNVTQAGVANTFGPKIYPMYATFASGKFQFHSPCGLLAIALKGTGTIGSIVLSGNADEYLCGDYFFETNDMAHPSLVGYKKYITLTFSDGLQLSDETQTVYFSLPAGVFASGFTAVINNMGGNEIYTLGTTKDNTIVAECITLMPTVSVAAIGVTTGTAVEGDVPTTVTLNGSYSAPTGMSVTEVGFYFGQGTDLTKYPATLENPFSLVREGLAEGTEYTYQAYAVNGSNEILGSVETFTTMTSIPEGVINGKFTINASGDQVYFSKGNLQYTKSTGVWSFMENQYDLVETAGQNVGWGYANQDVVSLFGWGTSGYDHGANVYQPWATHGSYSDYYAYGNEDYNLYDSNGKADWGYNAISNGGDRENSGWRMLTIEEWGYLFNTRTTPSGIRFVKADVNDIPGVILLPDDWDASYYELDALNGMYNNWWYNYIDAATCSENLEAHGAVFLPAAGYRSGNNAYQVNGASGMGCYWSSSNSENIDNVSAMWFGKDDLSPQNTWRRGDSGISVRLVRNAN